jgi:cell division protein FtsQ
VAAFIVVDFLALLAWGIGRVSDPGAVPIRGVHIEGEFRQLKPAELRALVAQELRGGFFTVGVAEIRAGLRQNPWVDQVAVRRVWPDGIKLTIVERRALARWGEAALLSPEGAVFSPPPESIPPGLVRLAGPEGSEAQVLARFLTLRAKVAQLGAELTGLRLSPRRSWSFEVKDGIQVIVGRTNFEHRVDRFLVHYRRLRAASEGALVRVDLRYTNGFAVQRQASAEPGQHSREWSGEKA